MHTSKKVMVTILSICLFNSMGAQSSESISLSSSESILESILPSYISDSIKEASGTIIPIDVPRKPPVRVEAGGSCIVDLTQAYSYGNFIRLF